MNHPSRPGEPPSPRSGDPGLDHPSGTVILGQLGVLGNLGAVLQEPASV
jgi:hypothetical protein